MQANGHQVCKGVITILLSCVLLTLMPWTARGQEDGGITTGDTAARVDDEASSQGSEPASDDSLQEAAGEESEQIAPAEQAGGSASATPVNAAPVVQPRQIKVSVAFNGTDGTWASISGIALNEGSNAWDATRLALERSGLEHSVGTRSTKDVIVSISSPNGGEALASNTVAGSGWHLYLNGERYLDSASTLKLKDGDEISWTYEIPTFEVSVAVIGPGGTGTDYWIAPTSVSIEAGQSAWDATLVVFEENGYTQGRLFTYVVDANGSVWLESLSGLGESGITGESWQLFINGTPTAADAAHVELVAGDSVCWYYVGNGVYELPAFVSASGAASQNPVVGVRIDGVVTQAWVTQPSSQPDLTETLCRASGVVLSGDDGLRTVVARNTTVGGLATQTTTEDAWERSLAHSLNTKLYTGQGGRSVRSGDGSLFYLDDAGRLVKLEVQVDENAE